MVDALTIRSTIVVCCLYLAELLKSFRVVLGTLYVPAVFSKKLSDGMKQWWSLKSKNFDTVLFFK